MESKVHELDDLKGERNYRGCLVTKLIGAGYSIWGINVSSGQEVDEVIDHAGNILLESISNRPEKITVKAGNGSFVAINSESGIIGSPDDLVG